MKQIECKKPLHYTKIEGKKAKPIDITNFNLESFSQKIEDMKQTSDAYDGMGLAGIQIGIEDHILVVKQDPKDKEYVLMFNAKIVNRSQETVISREGCLSIPKIGMPIKRNQWIEVEFFDGKEQRKQKIGGVYAIALQHEIAHLEGRTLFDDTILNREEKRKLLKRAKAS
jgi:peptide deformylase